MAQSPQRYVPGQLMNGHAAGRDGFVGRSAELARFDQSCSEAMGGGGRLLVVSGVAGIGKTRLCQEAAARAERVGMQVVWGRCWGSGGASALWPWQAVLGDLCGPSGAALLDGDAGSPTVDHERFARFSAATEALAGACADKPVFLVIDDAHAADPGAVLLARFVSRSLQGLGLVLVLTRRVEAEDRDSTAAALLYDLEAEGTAVPLGRLSVDDSTRLLAAHDVRDIEPAMAAAITQIADGNPLFLQRVASLGPPDEVSGMPRGLRRAVGDSVDRLLRDQRMVLSLASILGIAPAVAEVAAVADVSTGTVLDAFEAARSVGLVGPFSEGICPFSHEVVREVLEDSLTVAQRLDGHARAAGMLAPGTDRSDPAREARRAHHAVRAASRSRADAALAVTASRAAAASMMRNFAYEQASKLLTAAVRISQQAQLDDGAELLLERAQAVLLSGRLADARERFDEAAAVAEAEGSPVLLAEAALGLGGVWVNEHRSPIEWQRVHALQRRALEGLEPDQTGLRCRLRARLAAEAVYAGADESALRSALDEARQLGDPRAVAEALSLLHHVLLAPSGTAERMRLADELIGVASANGDGLQALMGLCYRTTDMFQRADPGASGALAALRERADAIGNRSIRYIASVLDVMLLIRSGRLAEAEDQAAECFALGIEVGDADALAYYGAHLVTVCWLQGRNDEGQALVRQVVDSPTLARAEFTFRATAAVFSARADDLPRARALLDQVTAGGLESLPMSSTWLSGMLAIAEAARLLDDRVTAASVRRMLEPFAGLPVMPSLAVVDLGSTERAIGLTELTAGDWSAAVEHLERGLTADIRSGNRPFAAIGRAELATALMGRDHPGDLERASKLLDRSLADAAEMGMAAYEAQWHELRSQVGHGREAAQTDISVFVSPTAAQGGAVTQSSGSRRGSIRRTGRCWEVSLGDRQVLVEDRIGMTYLARLLTQPGTEIDATHLASGGTDLLDPVWQPVLDDRARTAYARRAEELAAELAEARSHADPVRIERLELEAEALTDEVERSSGLGGRSRSFAGPGERARTSVRKAIKRALDEIEGADPVLAAVLAPNIRTGSRCSYTPDPELAVAWTTSGVGQRVGV